MPNFDKMPDYYTKGFTRSNYKMHCFICDRTIRRGDEITQMAEYGGDSMRLRVRSSNQIYKDRNLTYQVFYTPETGARWVHKLCTPLNGWTDWTAREYSRYCEKMEEKEKKEKKEKGWTQEGYHDGFTDDYSNEWDIY